jgi:hypothetical protein
VIPGEVFFQFTPHARVAAAVAPVVIALFFRVILGNCRTTRWMISFAVVWFAVNVLMAPYSVF